MAQATLARPGIAALHDARISVAVIGATGYVGGELVRLLDRHPNVRIVGLQGRGRSDERIAGMHPHLGRTGHRVDAEAPEADAVFLALPQALLMPSYHPPQHSLLAIGMGDGRNNQGAPDLGAFEVNASAPGAPPQHAPPEMIGNDGMGGGCGCRTGGSTRRGSTTATGRSQRFASSASTPSSRSRFGSRKRSCSMHSPRSRSDIRRTA